MIINRKKYRGPICPFCGEKLILDMNRYIESHDCAYISIKNLPLVKFDAMVGRFNCLIKAEKKRRKKDD